MGRPLLSAPWGRGPGTLWVGFPSPAPPAAPTCRVGSRAASWESCSLKALSFSSYWLGEGQAASSPRGGQLASPGTTGWGGATAPPALRTLPRQPLCALSLPAFLTGHWAVRSPGRGGAWPGYLKGGWGAGRGPHSPLHSLQQQRSPLRQFVLGGTVCYRPGTPSPAAAQLRRSAGPQVHTGSPPSLQARLPEPAACLPASRCLGVPESSPQTPPPGGSPP